LGILIGCEILQVLSSIMENDFLGQLKGLKIKFGKNKEKKRITLVNP